MVKERGLPFVIVYSKVLLGYKRVIFVFVKAEKVVIILL